MASSNYTRRAKELIREALPSLRYGENRTNHSTLHRQYFVGELEHWEEFEREVYSAHQAHPWDAHREILAHRPNAPKGPLYLARNELVVIGDEHGVQGRFNQHISQVMTGIFYSQRVCIAMGDFKAGTTTYSKVPDIAVLDWPRSDHQPSHNGHTSASDPGERLRTVLLVGELKTPWIEEHQIEKTIDDEHKLRKMLGKVSAFASYPSLFPIQWLLHIPFRCAFIQDQRYAIANTSGRIGQIAEYMKALKLRYGFLSNYNETIFLRQVERPVSNWQQSNGHGPQNAEWCLQHSSVIRHNTKAARSVGSQGTHDADAHRHKVSLRQCMWHICNLVAAGHQADNMMPDEQWVDNSRT